MPEVVKSLRVPTNSTSRDGSNIMKRLSQDGIFYYSAIFGVNAALIISTPRNTPVTESWSTFSRYGRLEFLIPVMMMSKITLNLKKSGAKMGTTMSGSGLSIVFAPNSLRSRARNTHDISDSYTEVVVHTDPGPADTD
ncbi:hypothetical protein MSAN_00256300 [Mycena sanguinolenta]|uniref:Uncharacterized protein n=1 Tax=Mycena sanguinolenta TaxID=230812 RepID=A0A8H6ZG14_9AGAR|nr:hypothetical protein MSAN_00256300 [Mycena sanguinolenta]